jgi:hypothetical protein
MSISQFDPTRTSFGLEPRQAGWWPSLTRGLICAVEADLERGTFG